MLEKEIVEANVATAHNYRHLVEYMKYMEFHKDKADRISQAWINTQCKHIKEIVKVQDVLPSGMRKKAHKQTFRVESTQLNLKACSFEDYPMTPRTMQLDIALEYISRMCRTDAELQAMEDSPSSPPLTPGQE
jgi:hypothetical protein